MNKLCVMNNLRGFRMFDLGSMDDDVMFVE